MKKLVAVSNWFLMFLASIWGIELLAPIDGQITIKYANIDDRVGAGDLLMKIRHEAKNELVIAPNHVNKNGKVEYKLWRVKSVKPEGSKVTKQQILAVLV